MSIQEAGENTGADSANLTARERAALLNETTYRELLDLAPDGIVAIDGSGQMLLANVQAHRLFGYPPGTLVGQSVDVLLPEAMRGAHAGHRTGYMANPRPRPMGAGLDLIGLRSDGSEFAVEISLSPIHAGNSPLVMAAIRDISDRKRAEIQIKGSTRISPGAWPSSRRPIASSRRSATPSPTICARRCARIDGFSQALVEDYGDRLDAEAPRLPAPDPRRRAAHGPSSSTTCCSVAGDAQRDAQRDGRSDRSSPRDAWPSSSGAPSRSARWSS